VRIKKQFSLNSRYHRVAYSKKKVLDECVLYHDPSSSKKKKKVQSVWLLEANKQYAYFLFFQKPPSAQWLGYGLVEAGLVHLFFLKYCLNKWFFFLVNRTYKIIEHYRRKITKKLTSWVKDQQFLQQFLTKKHFYSYKFFYKKFHISWDILVGEDMD